VAAEDCLALGEVVACRSGELNCLLCVRADYKHLLAFVCTLIYIEVLAGLVVLFVCTVYCNRVFLAEFDDCLIMVVD